MGDLKYPWPCSVNVANFVTVRFCLRGDGSGDFRNWKEQMLCLLEGQDVLGFVEGEIEQPTEENEYKKAWRRTDRLVKGWILGSIEKDALDAVSGKETARDVWLELHSIFEKKQEETQARIISKIVEEVFQDEEETGNSGGGDDSSSSSSSNKWLVELYKAAQRGDWDLETLKNNSNTIFSSYSETPLHVAVATGKANHLVEKLVETMPTEALYHKNHLDNTALHSAAIVENTKAAAALLDKCPDLLLTPGMFGWVPIMIAASYNRKKTLECLISRHEADEEHKAYISQGRFPDLLGAVINSDNIDIALALAGKYPNLALLSDPSGYSALSYIALRDNLFPQLETFNWWQTFIYQRIPVEKSALEAGAHTTHDARDIENLSSNGDSNSFRMIISGVPKVKDLREKKAMHQQALQLVKYLCDQIASGLPERKAVKLFESAMKLAAKSGIGEVVEIIIRTFPSVIYHDDPETDMDIFLIAAAHRFENVFNLIYSLSDRKYMFYITVDNQNNNLLHICGKLAPPHRLNLVPGAALQMQRELQWFKKVENFVHPCDRTFKNKDKETPQMVFTREHAQLKAEGERWMKDTASACTIAAALIATVVFAAAFTVPGGVESTTGVPLLSGKPVFNVFAVSDAVSFFTSITSLLMFLSILTSRYAEQDFLYSLPKRLAIGLLSLFLSITFMLIAFSAALYLLFQRDLAWFGVLVAALACLPVTSFVMLQFPLLVDVIYLTYGPGIFGKKSDILL